MLVEAEIHADYNELEQKLSYYSPFLNDSEVASMRDAIFSSHFLEENIYSFREHRYREKKTVLIERALKGLLLSKTYKVQDLVKIANPGREGRILSKETGIYKKNRQVFTENLVWELSLLLGCDQYIVPSLPLFIHGDIATFQLFEPISCMSRFIPEESVLPFSMALDEYWVLAIFTFLIGHGDLNGDNLHFVGNSFRLVDNDWAFPENNRPYFYNNDRLRFPLINVLIDFVDGTYSLTDKLYEKVVSTLANWKNRKRDVEILLSLQQEAFANRLPAFWERWESLIQAEVPYGVDLKTFIKTAFPDYFKGIEEGQKIASEILGFQMGPMSTLHLLGPFFHCLMLDEETLQKVNKWKYVNY